MLYEHFNDHLIISCNPYFDGIIQPIPFWDFPLLLSLSQSNLSKPFGKMEIIALLQVNFQFSALNLPQTNRPDSRFVLEAIIRALISKLSWNWMIKRTLNCEQSNQDFQPDSSYLFLDLPINLSHSYHRKSTFCPAFGVWST